MSTLTKEQEQYIEHEVRLRVHDEKFLSHEKNFERLESKMNWLISLVVGGWILPIILHYLKVS